MTSCFGTLLLFGVIVGGVYLYFKVSRLNQEIANQRSGAPEETGDDKQ